MTQSESSPSNKNSISALRTADFSREFTAGIGSTDPKRDKTVKKMKWIVQVLHKKA